MTDRKKVIVDSWAWFNKADLTPDQQERTRAALTIVPDRGPQFREEGEDDPGDQPLHLYAENDHWLGLAREYFLARRQPHHDVEFRCTPGSKAHWPGDLQWNAEIVPRPEQERAARELQALFLAGTLGGLVQAKPGWGKTIFALYLASLLQVPVLVVVHKEFLADQWRERIFGAPKKGLKPTLLNAKVGVAQEDECDFRGKHIVIGMVHSLAKKAYPREFYTWPGLVIFDEVHRVGARTWSVVPAKFRSRWRLGVTATPRRKDGCERVFRDHIGPVLFRATEERLPFKVRRVWTEYKPPKSDRVNLGLAGKAMLLTLMAANPNRNAVIVAQLMEALRAGRKVIVLSERLEHLDRLEAMLRASWKADPANPVPTMGRYVGGMTANERTASETCQVIFATYQYAAEGLDIPPLDTAFLALPYSDVEQSVGRIQRPSPGKKSPVVVDFRDDHIAMFRRSGETREAFYRKAGALS